ncbi:hypothetical protein L596_015317 [Steinernema carpocapsae]|nr:hypothetical protein L596_015317 [Steinernema carpocapsae]
MVTVALFSIHCAALVSAAFATFRLSLFGMNSMLVFDDYDVEVYYAIGAATVSVAILSLFLPSDGSPMLSILCSLTTSIFGIGAFKLNSMPLNGIGVAAGLGAAFGAILFWFVLDVDRKAISDVLAKNYEENSELKLKPKVNLKIKRRL